MLKSILCLCLLVLATAHAAQFELNESVRFFLAHAKNSDLPASVRLSLTKNQGRGASDASHWCCINEQPVTTLTETKIEHATHVVTTKTKVGYVDCGFMGLMKCSHYTTSTRTEIRTFVQTFQVPNLAACSSADIKCCSGFLAVAGNCHAITELVANQELFQFLANLGLLTMPGK